MPEQAKARGVGKLVVTLLGANLCVWIYFWIGFAYASYPYQPLGRNGHPSGSGFTFWHNSIGLGESGLTYLFFRIVHSIELPSFIATFLCFRIFDPPFAAEGFFLGLSEGGWYLIVTMMVSFCQWYFVGWAIQKLRHRWFNHLTAAPGHASSTPTTR